VFDTQWRIPYSQSSKNQVLINSTQLLLIFMNGIAYCESKTIGLDGNELLNFCTEAIKESGIKDTFKEAYCGGYIAGYYESNTMYQTFRDEPNVSEMLSICVPKGVLLGQLILVVVNYLKNHPEKLHLDRRILVQVALKEAFPCKK